MTLLGGMGTVFGPVVGAVVIITHAELPGRQVGAWVTVILGVIFVVCVLAFRRGIVGELGHWLQQAAVGSRRRGAPVPELPMNHADRATG